MDGTVMVKYLAIQTLAKGTRHFFTSLSWLSVYQDPVFNYCMSCANVIENIFCIMTTKWRIFRRPIIAHPNKVTKQQNLLALFTTMYLKITDMSCSASSVRQYCPQGYVDHEDPLGNFIHGA